MSRAVVVVGGPSHGLPAVCHTVSGETTTAERSLVPWLAQLFEMWQSEAEEAQQQMDCLERELAAGLSTRDRFDTGWYYWRGRRDGFENAAYALRFR